VEETTALHLRQGKEYASGAEAAKPKDGRDCLLLTNQS
jgi:hypothetical protein